MVWIYGGGFEVGWANRDLYGPDYFMKKGIVLVTLNYRVGCLGNAFKRKKNFARKCRKLLRIKTLIE